MFVFCENPLRIRNPNFGRYMPGSKPFFDVPCGSCILCRMRQRKEWTLRLRLEASMHKDNCFVTLTYDDVNVPNEVCIRDLQLFIKRLRKNSKLKFRYYAVSEYGDNTQRPHFHVILFGYPLEKCNILESTWGLGFVEFSPLNDARCNYTCGYVNKKFDKKCDKSLYTLFPYLTYHERLELYLNCGDILEKEYKKKLDPRRAEFATCSLGIGIGFLLKNLKKIKEEFCIHFGGKKYSIPRYFRKKIEENDSAWIDLWKEHQEEYAKESMINLFDRVSEEFVEQPFDLGDDIIVSDKYEDAIDDRYRQYVAFRAESIKRKREILKSNKKDFKEI